MNQTIRIYHGDCASILRDLKVMPDNSVRAIVSDPPYGLGFMGKDWDKPDTLAEDHGIEEEEADESMPQSAADRRAFQKWAEGWLKECHRVLVPGGLAKIFGGTRMFHRMGAAMQNVGFQMESLEAWTYGSGFPKSMNIQKALDKTAGVAFDKEPAVGVGFMGPDGPGGYNPTVNRLVQVGESTAEAKRFEGYGTALKPAWEPFIVGRKAP